MVEASSFQLESISAFRPDMAVLLNLTPDHLDRHGSFEAYGAAKARMFENQTEEDAAIMNADDADCPAICAHRAAGVLVQPAETRRAAAASCATKKLFSGCDGTETVLLERRDIGLRGDHNIENVLAAAAAATLAGVEPAAIAEGVRTFAGVEHRIEFVATISGVEYFNDSKATNVDATLKALDAFPGNVLVILGGKDKGSDYTILRHALRSHARMALLIGSAADKIETELAGVVPVERAERWRAPWKSPRERAQPGDTVLLAPACASFDQFENYEHRGRVFKQLVRELAEKYARRQRPRERSESCPGNSKPTDGCLARRWPCAWSAPSWCSALRPSRRATSTATVRTSCCASFSGWRSGSAE